MAALNCKHEVSLYLQLVLSSRNTKTTNELYLYAIRKNQTKACRSNVLYNILNELFYFIVLIIFCFVLSLNLNKFLDLCLKQTNN